MNIGNKIKMLRVKMNLTQEDMDNRCELSKSFISQLERNLTSPSIATLVDILEGLGSNLKDFFSEESSSQIVFGAEDFFLQENADSGYSIIWIVKNAQKNVMEPILLKLLSKGQTQIYPPQECEVFGYVLSGKLNLHIGKLMYRVKQGECFYYKVNDSYYLENVETEDGLLIFISTPPTF